MEIHTGSPGGLTFELIPNATVFRVVQPPTDDDFLTELGYAP